ncbi:MAG: peptide chain release factor 2 [Chloroflexi bacterium]|nr:peptide chain release factor 2 [Chloroflexota bacterium]
MQELREPLEQTKERISALARRLDIAGKEEEARRLEARAAGPSFWDDPEEAGKVMRRLDQLKATVATWRELEDQCHTLEELLALSLAEGEVGLRESLAQELTRLSASVDSLEFQRAFSGRHDQGDAILAIHAGAGGTDAHDWATMLLRMYLRWADRRGLQAAVLDTSPGEEAGIKSATVSIKGPYAYGWLKSEKGVHRLVRISPFDASRARHTSFALVEVLPDIQDTSEVGINPDDLRIDYFRASGHGGQNVQKTATAVRIVHLPSGITAMCQNERSQRQNREVAMRILRARLADFQLRKQAEEMARLKGEHVSAEFGNQIRSYVVHPYKMVKDHRTSYQTSDVDAVLDGDLDSLLKAYLATSVS